MTVKELRVFLEKYPEDMKVAYYCCSEQCLLEDREIKVEEACAPRYDGWVQNKRPDMKSEEYLVFPGN